MVYNNEGVIEARKLTTQLGYSKSTLYKIISNGGNVEEKYSHPKREKKLDDQQMQIILYIIEEKPNLTLKEILESSVSMGIPAISQATLHNYLKDKLITLKKSHFMAEKRNTNETKNQRKEYAEWYLKNQNYKFIYVDEFGSNVSTHPILSYILELLPMFRYV